MTKLLPNQRLQGSLTASDGLNPQRSNRFSDSYLLQFRSQAKVRLTVQSTQFDPYLQVINARTGEVLTFNDDWSPQTLDARLVIALQPNVDYLVRVTSYSQQQMGDYTLSARSLSRSRPRFDRDAGYGLLNIGRAVAVVDRSADTDIPDLGGGSWGLDQIRAPEAWAKGATGEDVVVAILDTGVDYTHRDLAANLWQNTDEIADNGIDDDRNGYVDDVRGWNFVDTDSNNPFDRDGHGTHLAGTIAAANNSLGTTGVAYDARIMPIRVIGGRDDRFFSRFDANVAAGIRYAIANGADVLNLSLGSYPGDPPMLQTRLALKEAAQQGIVAVMASGNERQEPYGATEPIEPAIFAREGWGIAVGAVTRAKKIADFSNPAGDRPLPFVVAPGVGVRSTFSDNFYTLLDGTSMSTAFVSGAVALLLDMNPRLRPAQIASLLTTTTQSIAG